MKKLMNFLQIKRLLAEYLLILFWVTIISIIALWSADLYYNFFHFSDRSLGVDRGILLIDSFHAIEITTLTFILIIVAWRQLSSLNKTGTADFLLRIDERFSSKQIIDARTFLHKLYIQCRPDCSHDNISKICQDCHLIHMQSIRDAIKNIRHNPKLAKQFMQLRNLLELFETVGYFEKKGYVDFNQINELVGCTIVYHYEVFRDWIHYLQDSNDPDNFIEFEGLIYKINPCLIPKNRLKRYET